MDTGSAASATPDPAAAGSEPWALGSLKISFSDGAEMETHHQHEHPDHPVERRTQRRAAAMSLAAQTLSRNAMIAKSARLRGKANSRHCRRAAAARGDPRSIEPSTLEIIGALNFQIGGVLRFPAVKLIRLARVTFACS